MNRDILPTLAQIDLVQVLIVGAVIISMVGGQLAKALKKAEQRRALERMRTRQSAGSASSAMNQSFPRQVDQSAAADIDELAARRRQKLQELASKRQASRGRPTTPILRKDPARPDSGNQITRAQRLQQARVEALAKQRVEAQRLSSPTRQSSPSGAAPASRANPSTVSRRQAATPVSARPSQRRGAAASPLPPPYVTGESHHSSKEEHHETVRRREQRPGDTVVPAAKTTPAGVIFRDGLSGVSLRDAVLLKEILDRPLALRG